MYRCEALAMTLHIFMLAAMHRKRGDAEISPRLAALMIRYGEAMALRVDFGAELGRELPSAYMRRHNLRYTCPIEAIDAGAFDHFLGRQMPTELN